MSLWLWTKTWMRGKLSIVLKVILMHPWREELRRLYFVRAPPPRLHHPLHLCITLASRPSFWLSHQGSGCVRTLGLAVPNPLHLCARLAARPPVRPPYQDPGRLPFWPPYQDPGRLPFWPPYQDPGRLLQIILHLPAPPAPTPEPLQSLLQSFQIQAFTILRTCASGWLPDPQYGSHIRSLRSVRLPTLLPLIPCTCAPG